MNSFESTPNLNSQEVHTQNFQERKKSYQLGVREMFNEKMETTGVIRRIIEEKKSSFDGQEER